MRLRTFLPLLVLACLVGYWISPGRGYDPAPIRVEVPIVEPYGGCDEAYLYPDSPGADDCRALGYDIP